MYVEAESSNSNTEGIKKIVTTENKQRTSMKTDNFDI